MGLVALCGCADRPASLAEVVVVADSSGIQVTTVVDPVKGAQLEQRNYSTVLTFRSGAAVDFEYVSSGVEGQDGRFYIANSSDARVFVFDSAGQHIRTLGRIGAGPGEFRSIYGMFLQTNGLAVYDNRLARVTYFTPSGELIATTDVATPSDARFGPGLVANVRADTLMFQHVRYPPVQDAISVPAVSIVARTQTAALGIIDSLRGSEIYFRAAGEFVRPLQIPFARRLLMIPSPTGLVTAETSVPELQVLGFDLRPRRLIRFNVKQEAVSASSLDKYVDSATEFYPSKKQREAAAASIRRRPAAKLRPPIAEAYVGSTGELWVRIDGPGLSEKFFVFDVEGRLCCTTKVPKNARILDMNAKTVLLSRRLRSENQMEVIVMRADQ